MRVINTGFSSGLQLLPQPFGDEGPLSLVTRRPAPPCPAKPRPALPRPAPCCPPFSVDKAGVISQSAAQSSGTLWLVLVLPLRLYFGSTVCTRDYRADCSLGRTHRLTSAQKKAKRNSRRKLFYRMLLCVCG